MAVTGGRTGYHAGAKAHCITRNHARARPNAFANDRSGLSRTPGAIIGPATGDRRQGQQTRCARN